MTERLTIMTVHAHPDDETFANGGTMAKYAEQGIHTVNVCCTGGEEGEIVDPSMDKDEVKPRLREVRQAELDAAIKVLGIESLEMLGYRDSGMAGTDANQNPASFHMADPDEAAGRLVRLIRKYRPQVLASYDENGSYGHPDHIKAYQITDLAFAASGDPEKYPEAGAAWQPLKLYMSVWSHAQADRWRQIAEELDLDIPWLRNPDANEPPRGVAAERITTRVDVSEYGERKIAALHCHRTQIAPDFFLFKMPPEVIRRAFIDEEYIRVKSFVEAPLPEDDLFAGLR